MGRRQRRAHPDGTSLGSLFGKSLFNGIIGNGVGFGVDQLLSGLGYDPGSQLHDAVDEIRRSINDLNVKVEVLSEKIEQLLDGQDHANFLNSYRKADLASGRLSMSLASIDNWIATGAQPTESAVSDMQTVIRTSISDIQTIASNPTTGVIPLMMKAVEPPDVSDLDGYWDDIDVVRDNYRAVLAEGIVALDLLTRFDPSGTVAADLEVVVPVATDVVHGMYELGLPRSGPAGTPFAQLRHNDLALAGWRASIPVEDRDVWRSTTGAGLDPSAGMPRGVVEPILAGMAASYRPGLHGGKSLEQYLYERGVPTRVVYTDTLQTVEILGSKALIAKYYDIGVQVTIGEIRGNDYVADTRILDWTGSFSKSWDPVRGWFTPKKERTRQAEGHAKGAARIPVLRSDAANRTAAWQNLTSRDSHRTPMFPYQGRILLGDTTNNLVGFHTDFDPDRIHEAAFGTD